MRGFSALIVILVVSVLLSGGFFVFQNYNSNVKGVSTEQELVVTPGMTLTLISETSAWDMFSYLCETEEDCLESLESGEKWSKLSGGKTEFKEIKFLYDYSWEKYEWLKVFVRPSFDLISSGFDVIALGDVEGSYEAELDSSEVLLIPLSSIKDTFVRSAVFSGR